MAETLLKRVQDIMDLKVPEEEAKKKLYGTWMIVNENLELISSFDYTKDRVIIVDPATGNNKALPFKSMSVWLPETGLYHTDDGNCLFLSRIPKRQWYKSFHDSLYKIEFLNKTKMGKLLSLSQVAKAKRVDIYVDTHQQIWYRNIVIGNVVDPNNFVCTHTNYLQELKDWNTTCQ